MWHASAKHLDEDVATQLALDALAGAGDAVLGEWRERGRGGVVHVRRRLADHERLVAGGNGNPRPLCVRDVRGLPEEGERLRRLIGAAPHLLPLLRSNGMLGGLSPGGSTLRS